MSLDVPLPLFEGVLHPDVVGAFLAASVVYGACIAICMTIAPLHFARNTKALAWLPSLMVSFPLSISALVPVTTLIIQGSSYSTANTTGSRAVAGVFVSFLVTDSIAGIMLYPRQMRLTTGYIHHAVYLMIAFEFLRWSAASALWPMAFMELPTFIMALGNVVPSMRSELPFGVTFFVSRIAFHVYLVAMLYVLMPDKWFWICISAALPMHIAWFSAWAASYSKKLAQNAKIRDGQTPTLRETTKLSKLTFQDNAFDSTSHFDLQRINGQIKNRKNTKETQPAIP